MYSTVTLKRNDVIKMQQVSAFFPDFSQFPSLHPLFVHFPIVLIMLAMLTQIAHYFIWQKELSLITFILILTGFISAYFAGNFFNPGLTGLSESAKVIFERHRDLAGYTIWLAKLTAIAKFFSHFVLRKKLLLEILITILLVGSAVLVAYTAHYGAMLVHIEGVGPQGKFLELE